MLFFQLFIAIAIAFLLAVAVTSSDVVVMATTLSLEGGSPMVTHIVHYSSSVTLWMEYIEGSMTPLGWLT
jgi:hypothetical protein